jgi:hypothetical protein
VSWIFGVIGQQTDQDRQVFKGIHDRPLHVVQTPQHYIATGGIGETCFYSPADDLTSGWVVCGVGIGRAGKDFSFLNQDDWDVVINHLPDSLRALDGHFVILTWDRQGVHCHSDALGLRTLYLTKMDRFCAFSTRLDWIAKINPDCTLDLEALGSAWLLMNQLSHKSLLKHTLRLGPGGSATIKPHSIELTHRPWTYEQSQTISTADFADHLEELTLLPLKNQLPLSLALSGGLDSRVLLSILLHANQPYWSVHSLHHPDNPDCILARKITADLPVAHEFIEDALPPVAQVPDLVREYVGHNLLTHGASSCLGLQFYNILYEQNKVVIDGGLGEICRRRYLNRIGLHGEKLIIDNDIGLLRTLLSLKKAEIFTEEAGQKMEEGARADIAALLSVMPPVEEIGLDNWLDLMAIRTRFPNLAGFEQSRSDGYMVSYMPFAQSSLLQLLMNLPVTERRNGRLLRTIIQRNHKPLTRIPLAKDGVVYPYFLGTLTATLVMKLKKRLSRVYSDPLRETFLDGMQTFIQDTVRSTSVINCPYYDYHHIRQSADSYYSGQKHWSRELDWWLAFEVWRQEVRA